MPVDVPYFPRWSVRAQELTAQGLTDAEAEDVVRTEVAQGTVFNLFGYPVNIKDIAWAFLIMKMSKTPEGQKHLIKMLEIMKDMMQHIANMAHHESLTATYGSLFLQGLVLRRFGLITDADFGGWIAGMSATNAAEVGAEIMGSFPLQFKINLGIKR